jgi:hypothetical protein
MCPMQLAFLSFILCRVFISSLTCLIPCHFSNDHSKSSSDHISNYDGTSDLFSEAFKSQHHAKPCSKCRIFLISSIVLKKSIFLFDYAFAMAIMDLIWNVPSFVVGRDSSVSIVTGYGLNGPWIESCWRRDFLRLSRPVLEPTQPPIQWVPGLFPRGKAARTLCWPPTPILCWG